MAAQANHLDKALAQSARTAPPGAYAHNVDLDHRPALNMAIREVGGSWYLQTGHFWHSGWRIVDVTDPTRPEDAKFVPGTNNLDASDGAPRRHDDHGA